MVGTGEGAAGKPSWQRDWLPNRKIRYSSLQAALWEAETAAFLEVLLTPCM